MKILTENIALYLSRIRYRMKQRAATVLIRTIREIYNTSHLLKVIKQYRFQGRVTNDALEVLFTQASGARAAIHQNIPECPVLPIGTR
jgi:hypothetical protein